MCPVSTPHPAPSRWRVHVPKGGLTRMRVFVSFVLLLTVVSQADAQEARRRWERMCQIRAEKFDRILPEVMRENGIDMWIVMMREGSTGSAVPRPRRGLRRQHWVLHLYRPRRGAHRARGSRCRRPAPVGVWGLRHHRGPLRFQRSSSPSAIRNRSGSTCPRASVPPTGCRTPASSSSSEPSARITPSGLRRRRSSSPIFGLAGSRARSSPSAKRARCRARSPSARSRTKSSPRASLPSKKSHGGCKISSSSAGSARRSGCRRCT